MQKQAEIEYPGSTWNRSAQDEPLFIVCARDALAIPTIEAWIELARKAGVPETKIAGAQLAATRAKAWQDAHPDRVKRPD